MSIDITKTLIRKLAAQGDTFTHNTLRTLKAISNNEKIYSCN